MGSGLATAHCTIHEERVAAARCLSCREFFCGECITEHSGKLICASCLVAGASAGRKTGNPGMSLLFAGSVVQLVLAILICWASYYFFAQFLGDIPDQFHDGTIWE